MACAGLLAAPSTHAAATYPGEPGRFAYTAEPDSATRRDLFTRRFDGSGVRRITRTPRYEDLDPSWSADGRRIVWSCYGRNTRSDPYFGADVCVVRKDASHLQRLRLEEEAKSPAFSPDGRRIAYIADGPDDVCALPAPGSSCRFPNDEIFLMNVDGTERARLTENNVGEADLTWSPDGSAIAFIALNEEGEGGLYSIEVATGEERVVATDVHVPYSYFKTGSYLTSDVDWSPDGGLIAFRRSVGDSTQVFVTGPNGENQQQVTSGRFVYNLSPAWSPDGERLVVHSATEESGSLCILRYAGETVEVYPWTRNEDVTCSRRHGDEFQHAWQPRPTG
ncbi:MAG: hypothetical protein M3N53_13605 [Actinomycetota bacterium]|nr:hypothetical protein [Actinomycetota bacterium]